MSNSPGQAAAAAIERLRALRDQAAQRRERTRQAIGQVRDRNRQESLQAMQRVRAAGRPGHGWPVERATPEMNLYDSDEVDAVPPEAEAPGGQPPPPPPPAPRRPAGTDGDDWSQETWLH